MVEEKKGRNEFLFRVALLFLFLAPSSELLAPGAFALEPVTAKATVLKNKVKIGDEIRLFLQVDRPRKFTIIPPDEHLNLQPFEIKKAGTPQSKGQNRVQEIYPFTLTVFELGDLAIPPITVRYKDEDGDPGEVSTAPVPLKVISVGKKLTDKDDVRPIKGPASTGLTRFRNALLKGSTGFLTTFLVVLIALRIKRRLKDQESRKPPHERVFIELSRLKEKGYLEEKKTKEYFSEFSDILRRYLERATGLDAMEKTTAELASEMARENWDPPLRSQVQELLEEADLVKFAKAVPERSVAEKMERDLAEIVERTKPVAKK